MTENLFARTVERFDSESASIHRLFGGERRVAPGRGGDPLWESKLLDTMEFMDDLRNGRRPPDHFKEAMSTADFPLLFADSLDRQLYGAYEATVPTWRNYARAATVNDFKEVKRFATTGIRGRLEKVGELAEHKRRGQDEKQYTYSVDRYEAGFAQSWESMVNDDLDAFLRLPQDLADSARDSEEAFVTEMFCDANGPAASFYSGGKNNLLAGNPPLTRDALQAAITLLMKRKDDNGNPIIVKGVRLVVGTGLTLAAQEIIETTEYRTVEANGNVRIIRGNGVAANLGVDHNYWIDSVATTANADTSWWIFADPNGTRPALEFGRLRGYEAPALFEKIPDARRLGGGEEPFSFDTASAEKKIRHVFGGTPVDERMTVASNGSGS